MKKIYMTLSMAAMIFVGAKAQEMIVGGDMTNAAKWNVTQNVTEANKMSTVTFDNEVMTVSATNGDGNTNTNVTIWQKVNLKAGHRYQFNAHIKGNLTPSAFWCQFFVNSAVPAEGADYLKEADCFTQVNTWGGCASGYDLDVNLQDWDCKNIKTVTVTTDGEYTFACKLGIWYGTQLSFEVELDDFSLIDLDYVSTAVKNTKKADFELYPSTVTHEINIKSASPITSATILSVTGQQVLKAKNINGKIDVSNLKAGVYTVQVIDENNKKSVMKFIKK